MLTPTERLALKQALRLPPNMLARVDRVESAPRPFPAGAALATLSEALSALKALLDVARSASLARGGEDTLRYLGKLARRLDGEFEKLRGIQEC